MKETDGKNWLPGHMLSGSFSGFICALFVFVMISDDITATVASFAAGLVATIVTAAIRTTRH